MYIYIYMSMYARMERDENRMWVSHVSRRIMLWWTLYAHSMVMIMMMTMMMLDVCT